MRLAVVKSRSNEISRLMRARDFGWEGKIQQMCSNTFAMDLQDARVADPY